MTLSKAFFIGTFCPPSNPVMCYFYVLMAETIHEVQKCAFYVKMHSFESQAGVMDVQPLPTR